MAGTSNWPGRLLNTHSSKESLRGEELSDWKHQGSRLRNPAIDASFYFVTFRFNVVYYVVNNWKERKQWGENKTAPINCYPIAMSACVFMHEVLQKPHQNHNTFSLKLGQGVHTYVRDNLQFLSCYCWIHSYLPLWDSFIWISRRFRRLNVAPDLGVELVTEMWACDQSRGNVQMFSGNPGTQLSSSGWVGTKLGCQEQLWPFSYCDGSLSTGDSPTTGWHLWCPGVYLLSVAAYLLLHLQAVT